MRDLRRDPRPARRAGCLSRHTPLELARAAPVAFALDKLCSRTLRGMFTVHVDWDHGPGVVVDLSAIYRTPSLW